MEILATSLLISYSSTIRTYNENTSLVQFSREMNAFDAIGKHFLLWSYFLLHYYMYFSFTSSFIY
jgi:hypothetical protein